ncbi:MAG TPA: phosphomevalonate kinase [Virgibacillus sp.]|nr:phosphomevalonate kinase [Virgibacillus sp.]
MPKTPLCVKVPGKLMMAGEFAVLEPDQKLVVMAVDRFVYATLERSDKNILNLPDLQLNGLTWGYRHDQIQVNTDDKRISFVQDAMAIANHYLAEKSITLDNFTLTIKSELDDESGVKYGLGSSAAVVTSVISALLTQFLPEEPSAMLIFKLAAISHVKTQGSGSGADVAASSYGGILAYSSFQSDWLLEEYNRASSLINFIESEWRFLSIKRIELPEHTKVCIGWTGSPASTSALIKEVLKLKVTNPKQFQTFLNESSVAVKQILYGAENGELDKIFAGIKQNRQALLTVGKNAGVAIETPLLTELCTIAENQGGAGKPSGAGGGDCGIAFMPSEEAAQRLFHCWKDKGIMPLDVAVHPTGAIAINPIKK